MTSIPPRDLRRALLRRSGVAAILCACAVALAGAPRHAVLLREAAAASQAGDLTAASARLEEAARLRPDYPRIQLNLARVYAAAGQTDEALAALERLADMGLRMMITTDPGLARLRDLPGFQSVSARLTAEPVTIEGAEPDAFLLPDVSGILESGCLNPDTQTWYFADVRNRCVWQHDSRSGTLRKFTADEDQLDGVFRLVLDADRRTLWASTAAVGVMAGPPARDGERSMLVAIDLATGRVRARHAVPADGRKHLLGDFARAADGCFYATDSLSPIIWRLRPGGEVERWLESEEFLSLQGIAFGAAGRFLYVSDYANGIWRIDPATKAAALLTAPDNATFFGIDGIHAVTDGLLAVQNGVNPQRILRITTPSAAAGASSAVIAAQAKPGMPDLALGCLAGGRFYFVGDSGWALYDPAPTTPPASRTVTIHSFAAE